MSVGRSSVDLRFLFVDVSASVSSASVLVVRLRARVRTPSRAGVGFLALARLRPRRVVACGVAGAGQGLPVELHSVQRLQKAVRGSVPELLRLVNMG